MALKISIFFQLNGQGWSETYWNNENDPVAFIKNQDPLNAKPSSVLTSRTAILSPNAHITHIRASVDGQFRQEWGQDYGLPGVPGVATRAFLGIVGIGAEPVLHPAVRLEVQSAAFDGGTILKRRNYLGGVPADLSKPDGSYNPANPAFLKSLQNFFLVGDDRPFVVRSRPFAPTGVNITQFQTSADGLSATLGPDVAVLELRPVFTVNVRGIREPHGWNGIHRAVHVPNPLVPGSNLIQIGPRRKQGVTIPVWQLGDGGTVGLTTPTYHTITLVQAEALVKKSTGRPFGVPLGRRSRP